MSWYKAAQSKSDSEISESVMSAIQQIKSKYGDRAPSMDKYYVDLGGKAMWIENYDRKLMIDSGLAGGYMPGKDMILMTKGESGNEDVIPMTTYYDTLTHELTHAMQHRRKRDGANFRAFGEKNMNGQKIRTERAYHDRNIEWHARMISWATKGAMALREWKKMGKPFNKKVMQVVYEKVLKGFRDDVILTMKASMGPMHRNNQDVKSMVEIDNFLNDINKIVGIEEDPSLMDKAMQTELSSKRRLSMFTNAARRMKVIIEAEARKLWPENFKNDTLTLG